MNKRIQSIRKPKGSHGYLRYKKKTEALKSVLMLLAVLAIFLAGYFTTKTRMNYFTLIAVLGALPACKQLVSLIMFLRTVPMRDDDYEQLSAVSRSPYLLYECVVTSYEKVLPLDAVLVHKSGIFAYTSKKIDVKFAEQNLRKMLETHVMPSAGVRVFTTLKPFLERVREEAALDTDAEEGALRDRIRTSILAVSL